jgi:hypothetical protein
LLWRGIRPMEVGNDPGEFLGMQTRPRDRSDPRLYA